MHKFKEQEKRGTVTVTDKRMTRFWITLEKGVEFVVKSVDLMQGGEIFVPKIPSMKVIDLARLMVKGCRIKEIGIRPGEKIDEVLVTEDEARHTKEFSDFFVIEPEFHWWSDDNFKGGKKLKDGFRYASNNNPEWLTGKEMEVLVKKSLQINKKETRTKKEGCAV